MKKILSAILAVIMITALCACNNEPEKNDNTDRNTVIETPIEIKSEDVEVGKYIEFGAYEQDNDTSNGKEPIEWLVLDIVDGRALLISKYALDCKPYNETYEDTTWENCTLRKWLNEEFLNTAFSSYERDKIPTVTNMAKHGHSAFFAANPGNDTNDLVFLLGIDEANKYFTAEQERVCELTTYAIANGSDKNNENSKECWWLRSICESQKGATSVNSDGDIILNGPYVHIYSAVRPALWVELD